MKNVVHLLYYLAEFFLEWELFRTKFVKKIKTHISCSITFSRKSYRLWDNVENYGTVKQATDDNVMRRMRISCWITNATDTHWEYVIPTAFPLKQWLHERASILRYTYSGFLVKINITRRDHSALWPRRFTPGKDLAVHILLEAAGSQPSAFC